MQTSSQEHPRPTRISGFDVVRGFSVVSMVGFHLCYDLKYIAGIGPAWFAPPLQDLWRCSISWTFLFVAGCMCVHSRNNFRRAFRYLGVALAIFLVTSVVAVDTPISFGIIYCMGICTLCAAALERLGAVPCGPQAAIPLFVLFILLLPIGTGSVGIGPFRLDMPSQLYATPWLSWLGFPGPQFSSSDYYPPIPYLLMYLAGMAMGTYWQRHEVPRFLSTLSCAPLAFVGRHALEVYVLHQPILLMITGILSAAGSAP